jgi:hypothetical protein
MLDPPAFVWCNAGPHADETLHEIVERKKKDIACFGWCLWAYGAGAAHPETQVRRLAREFVLDQPLALLMPDTGDVMPPSAEAFSGYTATKDGPVSLIPEAMSPVTGTLPPPGKTSRTYAFLLSSLDWCVGSSVDPTRYRAPYHGDGTKSFAVYRRTSHGRACVARYEDGRQDSQSKALTVHVVGEMAPPYAVYLVA